MLFASFRSRSEFLTIQHTGNAIKIGKGPITGVLRKEATVTTGSDEARSRAEKSFKKEMQAKEGEKTTMEYHANSKMIREKTERLRALRLAKEAADR